MVEGNRQLEDFFVSKSTDLRSHFEEDISSFKDFMGTLILHRDRVKGDRDLTFKSIKVIPSKHRNRSEVQRFYQVIAKAGLLSCTDPQVTRFLEHQVRLGPCNESYVKTLLAITRGIPPIELGVHAVLNRMKEVIRVLYDRGCDFDQGDRSGFTPMHWTAFRGDLEVLQELYHLGVSLDPRTPKGNTPLHIATSHRQQEVMKFLLEKGAKVSLKNEQGQTAMQMALEGDNPQLVQVLRK